MAKGSTPPEAGKPIRLSKSNIDSISEPGTYPDTDLTGFKLWVGKGGVKSYQMVGKVKGESRPVYVTIGKHGDPYTPDGARKEAERLRLLMRQGVNPNQQTKEKRAQNEAARIVEETQQKLKDLTLAVAFEEYLGKEQKPSTVKVYRYAFNKHFRDWLSKPLLDVTQDDIRSRFDSIYSKSPSSAAHVMRILRGVFNTAKVRYGETIPELDKDHPIKTLSHFRKGWNSLEAREGFIVDSDLPFFYQGVMSLTNTTARDYLMVCILTGLRKSEACTMKWGENVDVRKRTITIVDTKNKQKHMLAMSTQLFDLFMRRWESRDSEYVFPGKSVEGHFNDPEKGIKKVIEEAGRIKGSEIEPFSSHSLRRTFATIADGLGYKLEEVQRLLNHKPGTITERHYIQNLVSRTQEPMQRINDRLFDLMTAESPSSSNVLPMTRAVNG